MAAARFTPVSAEYVLESDWPEPQWAVDGWWTVGSSGVIGGPPKSFKSTLGLELMLAFSTGVKFLGIYDTPHYLTDRHGLVIQEENSTANLRRQLAHLAQARGLGKLKAEDEGVYRFYHQRGTNLNLSFLSLQGFTLTDPEHLTWLSRWVTTHRVGYLLLDPMYLMLGAADENRGNEIRPVLLALSVLKERTGCASILIHHTGKAYGRQGGRALLGHTYIHGWYEVGVFPEAHAEYLTVETEFREMPPQPARHLVLDPKDWTWGAIHLDRDADGRPHGGKTERNVRLEKYRRFMEENPGCTREYAAAALRVSLRTLKRYEQELDDDDDLA